MILPAASLLTAYLQLWVWAHAEAEELKNKEGLTSSKEEISKTLYLLIDPLIIEVKKILSDFYQQEGKEVEQFI